MNQPVELAPGAEQLSADLLYTLLADAPDLAAQAHQLLAPASKIRHQLRDRLIEDGLIHPIGPPRTRPCTLAAADGALVKEHLYVADLLIAVAATAEGMTSQPGQSLYHDRWAKIVEHRPGNDKLLSAAMATLELQALHNLAHDIRILDGSYATLLIPLSVALSCGDPTIVAMTVDLITDDVKAAIAGLADPDQRQHPGEIVALPKADSAHTFSAMLEARYNTLLPGGDRFLASQLLEPGEMLQPRTATDLKNIHVSTLKTEPAEIRDLAADLDQALQPLRDAASGDTMLITYVRPETAATVIKMELQVSEPLTDDGDSAAITEVARMARILSDETPGPYIQEPFAQYLVDLAAKSIGPGAEALNAAMIDNLPPGSEGYLALLARPYRTQKAPPTRV